MSNNLFDVLTETDLRSEDALKQHLVSNAASGLPWLVAEIPE